MKQTTFHAMLKFAAHAAAAKDIRHYLNGVCFEFTDAGQLYMIGTDGHRMAVVGGTPDFGLPAQQIIVRIDDVKLLLTMAKPAKHLNSHKVSFTLDNGQLVITGTAGWRHACTPEDAKYPDWRRVARQGDTPKPQPEISMNADYLADACKACGAFGKRYAGVTITTYGDISSSLRVTPHTIEDTGIHEAFVIVMTMRK